MPKLWRLTNQPTPSQSEAQAVQELRNQRLMNKIKKQIKDVPFILLALDLIWWVLGLFKINILDYWWVGEIASHNLLFTFFIAFYGYIHRYCFYSWICIGSLALLNVLNITHYFCNFSYYQFYAGLIILPCLSFAIIRIIKNESFTKSYPNGINSGTDL